MLLGRPLSYVLLAPERMLGLNAGATGLAVKMVLLQILVVNVQLYFGSSLLTLRFWRYVAQQVASLARFLVVAPLATLGVDHLAYPPGGVAARFVLTGMV